MKKLIFLFSVCMAVIFFTKISGQDYNTVDVNIFFADRYMHRLIPVCHKIPDSSTEANASEVLNILFSGNKSSSFSSYINPEDKDLTIKIKGETAIVNFSKRIYNSIPKDRENQELFIYQIVNSLCSVQNISYVTFTVDKKYGEYSLEFIDLRQIFSPNNPL